MRGVIVGGFWLGRWNGNTSWWTWSLHSLFFFLPPLSVELVEISQSLLGGLAALKVQRRLSVAGVSDGCMVSQHGRERSDLSCRMPKIVTLSSFILFSFECVCMSSYALLPLSSHLSHPLPCCFFSCCCLVTLNLSLFQVLVLQQLTSTHVCRVESF